MPEAIVFNFDEKIYTINFSHQKAMLPVKMRSGEVKLVTWGRRECENSEMPLGGWVRLTVLKDEIDKKWHFYSPKSVLLPVKKFMERDFEGKACWYEVVKGKCLQGVLAKHENEYRVYIVTIDPEDLMNCHYRWPHVVNIPASVSC